MKILYIGTANTYRFYQRGINPSHWLYGAVEMGKEGNDMIWEDESSSLFRDILLIVKYCPDRVFIPNLNLNHHVLLLLLASLGLIKTPIYAYLHHEPKVQKGIRAKLYRLLLSGPKKLFFLSTATMRQSMESGIVERERCVVPGWGPDTNFYDMVDKSEGKYFVSTGKENRDFDILIEVFRRTGVPLKIMTAKSHAGNDYTDLLEKCKDIPNIEVIITENSGSVYPQMLEAMAHAKALVCPLRRDKLNYCVGLSTIADAIGLHKPLIITRNPYHDEMYLKGMYCVETIDDWVKAIEMVNSSDTNSTDYSNISMEHCWQNIKKWIL